MLVDQKDLIRRSAIYFADKPAMVCGDRSLSFRDVNERANRLANALADLGLRPGARVATLARNCPEYAEIEFGLIKGAFTQVTLNARLAGAEQLFQITDSKASVVIVQQDYAQVITSIREKLPCVKHFVCFDGKAPGMLDFEKLLASASPAEPPVELNLDDLGEIRYTSGTTGQPKGIMLPFRSGLAVTRNLLIDFMDGITSEDRWLALQPLHHGAGWFIFPVWVKGITQYIVPDYHPETAFEAIEKYKITAIKTVPTVLLRLLDSPDIRKRDISSVRTIIYGGSPMPVDRLKEAIGIFGPVFVQIYGQTEAPVTITRLTKEDHIGGERLNAVGRPCTLVHVRVVDDDRQDVAPGVLGEVVLRGDHQMVGYLNRPEATAETIRDGWIHTNDLGTVDKEGYVYLTGGRKTDMIITGGLNVFPIEVEQVLYQHPAVSEVCVIGVPHPTWGESIKACVVLRPGQSAGEQELIEFCKDRLASYKKPQSIDFLPELPHNAAGKISYAELRKLYQD